MRSDSLALSAILSPPPALLLIAVSVQTRQARSRRGAHLLLVGAAAPRGDAAGTQPGDRAVLAGWEHLTEVTPESWAGQGTGLGSDRSQITPSCGPRGSPKESTASHSAHRWSQEQSSCPPQCRVTPLSLHSSPAHVTSTLPKQKMRVFSTPGAAPHQTGGKWFKQGMAKLD